MFSALLSSFAEAGPTVHVSPAEVTHFGGLALSNSIIYGWISSLFLIVLFISVARRVTVKPQGGFVQLVESGVEFIVNLVENAFDDKRIARKYVPYFVTIFFFILFSNWLGLLPIVGEGFHTGDHPIFRPFTADLNGTFAVGAVTMALVYAASIKESGGIRKYLRHFFVGNPLNPLFFIIGILEMFTDLTRVFSLSLRLFLNVTIGEIVISVFSYLGQFLAPVTALPFTLIELFVGALQAYIFTILSVMYLAIAVNHAGDHSEEHSTLTEDEPSETMGLKPGTVGGGQGA